MSIAARLRLARELADVRQRDLDRLAARTEGHTGLIESRPESDVFAGTLLAFAEVLGISLDWLIAGKGRDPKPEDVKKAVESARARRAEPAPTAPNVRRSGRDRKRAPSSRQDANPPSSKVPRAKKQMPAKGRRPAGRRAA